MDTDLPLPSYVTRRNGVFYYVRRIPDDLTAVFGRRKRIQRSLRTTVQSKALSDAARINVEVERQLSEARAKIGIAVELGDVSEWTAEDWKQAAAWFEARLIQDDLERRLPSVKGAALTGAARLQTELWSDDALYASQIALNRRLEDMTVADYARERLSRVNEVLRRIGVVLLETSPHLMSFAATCMKAELHAIGVFFCRDRGQQVDWPHPDAVKGPWRKQTSAPAAVDATPPLPPIDTQTGPTGQKAGKTLADCQERWKEDRTTANKPTRDAYVREMSEAIALFEQTQGVRDIADIRRRHVVAFRSHLVTSKKFEVATINKKVSFITALLATAESHAWIENAVRGNVFLKVPAGDDDKEPFSAAELAQIFSHRIFTGGLADARAKAGMELQFWLPLISCTHGLISSEILQLGPDTIATYPGTDILCFNVTTAGGRHVKEFARRRWIPIRRELQTLGLRALAERAHARNWKTLWAAVENRGGDTTLVASYFSSFWSAFLRSDLAISDEKKSLYSFRHAFKDALKRLGAPEQIQNALMGHAEPGTGRRYGTKREAPPVPIAELNNAIQIMNWSFLGGLVGPPIK